MRDRTQQYRGRSRVKFCVDCDWYVAERHPTDTSSSRAALDHFLETGHTIESHDAVAPPPLSTRE